jgi:hypothetical protein
VRVLPYVREERNWLGPFDAANQCSTTVLDALDPPADVAPVLGHAVHVAADGNCLFHALARGVENGPTHAELRQRVAEWMRAHWHDTLPNGLPFSALVEGGKRQLAQVEEDGAWAGAAELVAAEHVLGRPVCVVSPTREPGRFVLVQGQPTRNAVYVSFHAGHYSAFVPHLAFWSA